MVAQAHTQRSHKRFSPSSMARIAACPGSVKASEGEDDRSSPYALVGTAAHELCELVLTTAADPQDYVGGVIDLQAETVAEKFLVDDGLQPEADEVRYIEVTDEMADGAILYRDFVLNTFDEFAGDTLELEQKFDMSFIHPEFGGTGDAVIYKPEDSTLHVIDLKFGMKVVEPQDNLQLCSYAVGAARKVWGGAVNKIVLTIIQPRAFHSAGPVRSWEISYAELEVLQRKLARVIKLAEQPNAPRAAGDHCFFCKAASFCDTLRNFAEDTATGACLDEVVERDSNGLAVISALTPEQLGALLPRVPVLRNWAKRIEERGYLDACDGRPPVGFKLVEKKPRRAWRDYNVALAAVADSGLDPDDYLTERKLRSVAQVEKALGKSRAQIVMRGLFTNQSTGTTLAPESDKREAVRPSGGDDFTAVEDEGDDL